MKVILTIGGSDPSGGAGIQADIKTFGAARMYGTSVITALTAQNSTGVMDIYPVPPEMVQKQLDAVFSDMDIQAVKIGMLATLQNVELVARCLQERSPRFIILDPVLKSSTGTPLLEENAINILKNALFPLATVITPNISEASYFAGMPVSDIPSMKEASAILQSFGSSNILIKGGHLEGLPVDVLYNGKKFFLFETTRVVTNNGRGLGCTFASAITVGLARGMTIEESVDSAKKFIIKALNHPFKIGHGKGPLNHNVALT
ncbi:MAG: bifunctional hydroxymethylpyrimidine kinase/phosphomethylpyrimidine kinase [Candidatus Schekmanbacteria bacterium RBG_13_48_7]|uniref:hydroxymethylpyrimidine kinase n=1 Tax=Candidatus Schekmanbacteria bacterium RBG_13_48_7 TaxID=1817878 RepID=A0A1F7RYA9_9BACT|nr:MAG: bifunctional hydroxymethylpyrimidine kinase/phosphomethylpyrimidine kinase [Candidatus Schekmanbacteria bacterium RBG_13_48_7]